MTYESHLIDKRVVDRNIAKGLVDQNLLKRQLESLPDVEANAVHVSLDGADDDDDDDDEDGGEEI